MKNIIVSLFLLSSCSIAPTSMRLDGIPTQRYVINGNMSAHIIVNHDRRGNMSEKFDTKPNGVIPNCLHYPGWFYGWHGKEFEYGTDFDCSFHTKMVSLWDGIVVAAYRTCWNYNCSSTSGGVVVIDNFVRGYVQVSTYYLHLDIVVVKSGEQMKKGDIIGLTGGQWYGGHWNTSPWFSSGPHIEIGFCNPYLFHDRGYNINPLPYIEEAIQ